MNNALSINRNLTLGVSFALGCAFLMSLTAALIKYTAAFTSIEIIVFAQYLVCLLMMTPWLSRKGLQGIKTDRLGLHVIRGLSGWACFYTYYLAIDYIPLVDAALLRNSAPLCVPFLLLFWLKIKIPLARWIPLIIGLAGITLILQPQGDNLSFWHLIGFISAISLSGSMVSTRLLTQHEPTQRILFYYFFISALAALPPALITTTEIPNEAWLPMLLIGASVWLVMWLYTQAYSYAKASVLAPLNYTGVMFAGLWGWVFWQQVPNSMTLVGIALVIGGGIGSVLLAKK